MAVLACLAIYTCVTEFKAVANGPVGQVLAGPLFLKAKIKFYSTKSNSTTVIFGHVQLVILWYSR